MKPNRRAVYNYLAGSPYTPTLREIGNEIGLSASTVLLHLRALEADGLVAFAGTRPYVKDAA